MKRALWLASFVIAGCSLLQPQPNRLRYFVLDGSNTAAPPTGSVPSPRLRIGVGPIALPDYLRRGEIVRRTGDHQLRLQSQDRWAEPLELGFGRVVVQAIRQLQAEWLVVRVPGPVNVKLDVEVPIEVLRFEDDGTSVHLSARWGIKSRQGDSVVIVRESVIDEPLTDKGIPAVVAAMGRAANRLATDIRDAIDSAPRAADAP